MHLFYELRQNATTNPGDDEAGVCSGARRFPRRGRVTPAPSQPRTEEESAGEDEGQERNAGCRLKPAWLFFCVDVSGEYVGAFPVLAFRENISERVLWRFGIIRWSVSFFVFDGGGNEAETGGCGKTLVVVLYAGWWWR